MSLKLLFYCIYGLKINIKTAILFRSLILLPYNGELIQSRLVYVSLGSNKELLITVLPTAWLKITAWSTGIVVLTCGMRVTDWRTTQQIEQTMAWLIFLLLFGPNQTIICSINTFVNNYVWFGVIKSGNNVFHCMQTFPENENCLSNSNFDLMHSTKLKKFEIGYIKSNNYE